MCVNCTATGSRNGALMAWWRSRAITTSMFPDDTMEKPCRNLMSLHMMSPASHSRSMYSQTSCGSRPSKITRRSAMHRFKMRALTRERRWRLYTTHTKTRIAPRMPKMICTKRTTLLTTKLYLMSCTVPSNGVVMALDVLVTSSVEVVMVTLRALLAVLYKMSDRMDD